MNFTEALNELLSGLPIARAGWNGVGQAVRLQVPDVNSKMTRPYCYIEQGDDRTPWVPSTGDLFSLDWYVPKHTEGDPPWLMRLRMEEAELRGRLRKLDAFLEGPPLLDGHAHDMLVRQQDLMRQLLGVLVERLRIVSGATK